MSCPVCAVGCIVVVLSRMGSVTAPAVTSMLAVLVCVFACTVLDVAVAMPAHSCLSSSEHTSRLE